MPDLDPRRFLDVPARAASREAVWLDLELAQWLPAGELAALQLRRLNALVAHAHAHSPFWRARLDAAGLGAGPLRAAADLAALPVLTKAEIQAHREAMIAWPGPREQLLQDATGGSTGDPLVFHRDGPASVWLDEAAWRFRRWMGFVPGDRIAYVWGADRDVPGAHPPHERWLNSFSLTPERMEAFARELVGFAPRNLRAYAGSVALLAGFLKERRLPAPRPLAIEASAERLFPEQRRLVEEVFGCKVFNVYGSREAPSLACECEAHQGLHVFADLRIIEVLRGGRAAPEGQEGSLVVTDLVNWGFPLLRYEIGDVGALLPGPCACGRAFPRLADVKGRVTGTITAPDGRWVHGEYFTHLFYGVPGVRSFQVRQRADRSLDVLVVPGPGFAPAALDPVLAGIRGHLGPAAVVRWQQVEAIPPTPTGKHLFTLSDVPVGVATAAPAAPPAVPSTPAPAPTMTSSPPQPSGNAFRGGFRTTTLSGAPAVTRDEATSPAPAPARRRPRICLIADVPGWIFERHCQRLQAHLSDEFEFDIRYAGQPVDEAAYDLVYPLEWMGWDPERPRDRRKWVTGIRSHISWNQLPFEKFLQYLQLGFQRVHVVSRRLEKLFSPFLDVTYLAHGIDTEHFRASAPASPRPGRLRLGWAGNRQSVAKGFEQYIQPLEKLPGVELVFCGYSDKNLGLQDMKGFYEGIDVYVCSSSTEGHNNSLMEAAAMERAIITTDVGSVPEYLVHERSALIVERELPAFVAAVLRLVDDPALVTRLGREARKAVVEAGFGWDRKIEDHRRFFREALEGAGVVHVPAGTAVTATSTATSTATATATPTVTATAAATSAPADATRDALARGDARQALREAARWLAAEPGAPGAREALARCGLTPAQMARAGEIAGALGEGPGWHLMEWTDARAARLNDWQTRWEPIQQDYFSLQVGPGVINLARRLGPVEGRVLDYGCGPGYLLRHLLDAGIACGGMDLSVESVLKVNTQFAADPRWQGARLFTGGALPYEEGSLDFIFCVEVIEHVLPQHMDGMLRDLRRLLRPGTGRLLITTPNDEQLERNMVCCPDCGAVFHKVQHVASYDRARLMAHLERHGFATEACLPTDFGVLQQPGAAQAPLERLFGAGPHLFWYGRAR